VDTAGGSPVGSKENSRPLQSAQSARFARCDVDGGARTYLLERISSSRALALTALEEVLASAISSAHVSALSHLLPLFSCLQINTLHCIVLFHGIPFVIDIARVWIKLEYQLCAFSTHDALLDLNFPILVQLCSTCQWILLLDVNQRKIIYAYRYAA
jgi:hypothetical protein